ncbi:uncharacterized protein LOC129456410 [Periophthalmus magnuspinnatus]|uniref:uncharacterized protein LOC129456410 n=1 Tax=Periophthalmus magnuspinnatus TaxID=409849 RepID=UPI00243696A2|nr:uncharacterized protein LOC129456410 [Periophthalmus magnuspinnatus]
MSRTDLICKMKLPTIASTPVCLPSPSSPARQSHLTGTSMTFPLITECAIWPSKRPIPRLDPLHPPFVQKRTVSLETPAVHYHNHQRALIMQRKEHYRCHQVWRKPFYGTSNEREEYRKDIRNHLKKQMEDKCVALKLQFTNRAKEAEYLCEMDRLALSKEKEQRILHRAAMTAFRDENKRLMEQGWRDRVLTRSQEALKERELLHLNPINWSGTLK